MKCRLCAWLCDRFCSPDASDSFWQAVRNWERSAFDWEPAEPGEELRARWSLADSLLASDPAGALAIHLELAADGSPYSMQMAAWHYASGCGTRQDPATAEEFYRRALCAGSWTATLRYADLLYRRGAHDNWPSTLEDGVRKGFIPSCFWLAWYRYAHSPNRRTAREVRPLLERAAEAGHPGARMLLVGWAVSGKFGLREIPGALRALPGTVRMMLAMANHDHGGERATDDKCALPPRSEPTSDTQACARQAA